MEPFRLRAWARVYRARVDGGVVWLKLPERAFAFEARLLSLLRPLAPRLLPEVIASEPGRGWLLLADEGDEREVDWSSLLPRYARLQRDAGPLAGELVALGLDDYRGERLGAAVERILPGSERAQELCAVIARSAIPPTVEHGDLRAANVRGSVILDWGDASVAHPFLSVAFGDPWRNRSAYVGMWPDEPETLMAAHDLRALWGALNWLRVVPYDPSREAAARDLIARFGS